MDPIDIEMLSSDSSYASDVSDDGSAIESTEKLKYKCKYCPKKFSTTQAFGGHQNAHKKEKESIKKQREAMLAHTNQPVPIPYPYHQFSNQYSIPPGFEQPRFKFGGPINQVVVPNFAGLQIDPSQEMGQGWATIGIPFQPATAQPQPLNVHSSVCLDLCLGIGSSSQIQAGSKNPNVAAEKEDDGPSLSLSLKL